MKMRLDNIIPVADVEHDAIVSMQGDITLVFRAKLPEVFTISIDEYENIHQGVIRALKALPVGTIAHKQDLFRQKSYQSKSSEELSFLSNSGEGFFAGRLFLSHECYFMITKPAKERQQSTSLVNNLIRRSLFPAQTIQPALFEQFENVCNQFMRLMQEAGIHLTRLKDFEILSTKTTAGLLEQYCSLAASASELLVKDIILKDQLQMGQETLQVFTISDTALLPAGCSSSVKYDRYSTDKTDFPISFAAPCGLLLKCDHIYNQIIVIKDSLATRQKLEKKKSTPALFS